MTDQVFWLFGLCVVTGVLASAEDLWRRKVSNPIAVGAFASGVVAQSVIYGLKGAGGALLGGLVGFVIFLVFYLLGGMGGGDIKLMAGFGAIIGSVEQVIMAAIVAALVGAVIAVVGSTRAFVHDRLRAPDCQGVDAFHRGSRQIRQCLAEGGPKHGRGLRRQQAIRGFRSVAGVFVASRGFGHRGRFDASSARGQLPLEGAVSRSPVSGGGM